jgi:hypothetical protein
MRPSLTGSEESVRDRVVEWEATLAKYTTVSGQDLSDDVKIAILLRSVAEVHPRCLMTVVSASASVSYSTVRDTFYQYLNSRQLWNPDAMDVNALWKGGGKSGKKGYNKKDKEAPRARRRIPRARASRGKTRARRSLTASAASARSMVTRSRTVGLSRSSRASMPPRLRTMLRRRRRLRQVLPATRP